MPERVETDLEKPVVSNHFLQQEEFSYALLLIGRDKTVLVE